MAGEEVVEIMRGLLLAFSLVLIGVIGSSQPAHALDSTAPESIIPEEAIAFRNLVECGDLLLLYRYHLPFDTDPEALDPAWAPYGVSGALARVMFNGQPVQDRVPPRLGHALMAHYLEPGHGVPWGSSLAVVQLGGNPGLFIDVNKMDRAINWSAPGADGSCTALLDGPVDDERQEQIRGVLAGLGAEVQKAEALSWY